MAKKGPTKLDDLLPQVMADIPAGTTEQGARSTTALGDPACPICGGLGFYRKDVPVGHPEFGRALPCRCVEPILQETRKKEMNALGSMEALGEMTFERFHPEGIGLPPERQQTLSAAYTAAFRFAEGPHGWLLLSGGFGVGKTHLAAAIGNMAMENKHVVIFIMVPDLLDHLRSSYSPESAETYDELFERLKDIPLLILDDMGAESSTAWAQEKLFQLLSHRHLRRLPTVITTNKPINAFEPRIRSRLMDHDLIDHYQILATDYRGGGYVDYLVELSELDLHAHQTFESFEVPRSGRQRNDIEACRKLAWNYADAPEGWLIFYGEPGAGKTHLAAAIANHIRQAQPQVLFISLPKLLDHLRAAFSPRSILPYDVRFEQVKQAPLLVLDDLHGKVSSPWAAEKLFQLVDYRYLTRKPTVFTLGEKGKDLQKLTAEDPRLVSRLKDESIALMCYMVRTSSNMRGRQTRFKGEEGEMEF